MLKSLLPPNTQSTPTNKSKNKSQNPIWQDPWANWAPDFGIQSKKKKPTAKAKETQPKKPKLSTPENIPQSPRPTSPHAFQEKHSATRALKKPKIMPKETDKNITYSKPAPEIVRRRILDARLWDNLTPHEQEAAMLIDKAYTAITSGLGFTTSNPARIPQGKGQMRAAHHVGAPILRYMTWAREAQIHKLDHASAIDILVFGKTCKAVDRDRRVRGGTAKKNLIACLSLFCKLEGWPYRHKI